MILNWNTQNGAGEIPPFYCVIDVETADPTPEDLLIEKRYMKNGRLKDPEKIREKQEAIRGGLTDSAPIFCIGTKTPEKLAVFSWGKLSRDDETLLMSQGILGVTARNEVEMLLMFAAYLQSLPEQTRLITSNGEHFDIPKLKFRYAKHDLPIPTQLFQNKHSDLMRVFSFFSVSGVPFFSVEEMAAKLGIPFYKVLSGAQVPEFVRDGKHADVILYNALDCVTEELIAKRLLRGKIL